MRGTLKKKSAGNRAAAYIRVSDESQVQGYSLDAQRIEIARWCERNGYQLILVYSDEGVSARTEMIEKRLQLVRLLDDARLKKFDIVVVHTLDRWARNIGVQRQAIRRLAEFEIGFTSATEDFDYSSPHGRLVLTMIGGAAEFFSDQLAVHVSKSQGLRAELGFPVGPVPFGYRILEPGGIPQLYKEEPGAVCKIYERRAAGESYGSLADWLNDQGFKTIAGGFFTSHAVRDLLECRFYLGKITYRGEEYPGRHEAIISEELYQRIQARKQKRDSIRSVQGPKGVLQGLIACGNCGKRIQSDRHRFGGAMYRERHSHQCETNNRSIMAKKVDEQIEAILTSVELRPEWRDEMAKLAIASVEGPTPKELKDKRRRLSRAYAKGHKRISRAIQRATTQFQGWLWFDNALKRGYVLYLTDVAGLAGFEPIEDVIPILIDALKSIHPPDRQDDEGRFHPYGGSQNWKSKAEDTGEEDSGRWEIIAVGQGPTDFVGVEVECVVSGVKTEFVPPYWRGQPYQGLSMHHQSKESFVAFVQGFPDQYTLTKAGVAAQPQEVA